MPKISVIMGIYNTKSRDYLEKSLKSILNQTYSDFELIICDDGSTNDCLNWAKNICKNDSRVKFISNEKNKGLAYTLNHCLKYAKGEYIARMDDDDESDLKRFEKQIKILENNEKIDVVSCNINLFDENGIYSEKKYNENIDNKDFLFNNPIVHPAVMVRTKAYELVDGYKDEKWTVRVEDYDLFMRMQANNLKMYVIQDKLLNYRNDRDNCKRRQKYKYRINEAIVRFRGYKSLKLFPKGILYIFKPLIIGIIPPSIISKKERGE